MKPPPKDSQNYCHDTGLPLPTVGVGSICNLTFMEGKAIFLQKREQELFKLERTHRKVEIFQIVELDCKHYVNFRKDKTPIWRNANLFTCVSKLVKDVEREEQPEITIM